MRARFKSIDIIGAVNILMGLLAVSVYEKAILVSAILFICANVALFIELHKGNEVSFFRYMWSFIITSVGCSAGVTVISDVRFLLVISMCLSLLYICLVFKDKNKAVLTVIIYAFCLSVILYCTIIGINRSFSPSEETNFAVTVVNKLKNGDWSGKNIFSQFDVYSQNYFEGTFIGYRTVSVTGDSYNQYDIGDKINLCFKKGIFGIKYCYY